VRQRHRPGGGIGLAPKHDVTKRFALTKLTLTSRRIGLSWRLAVLPGTGTRDSEDRVTRARALRGSRMCVCFESPQGRVSHSERQGWLTAVYRVRVPVRALGRIIDAVRVAGGKLVVDATDCEVEAWVRRHDFEPLPNRSDRLMVKVGTVARALDVDWPSARARSRVRPRSGRGSSQNGGKGRQPTNTVSAGQNRLGLLAEVRCKLCQGWGRGFESRRPLQKSRQSLTCRSRGYGARSASS
jgi:hypothetical protein